MITNKHYSVKTLPKCAVNGSIMDGKALCGAMGIGKNTGLCASKGYCKYQVKENKND